MAFGDKITGILLDLKKYMTKELANENLSARAEQSRVRYVALLSEILQSSERAHNVSASQTNNVRELFKTCDDKKQTKQQLDSVDQCSPHEGVEHDVTDNVVSGSSRPAQYIYDNILPPSSDNDPKQSLDDHISECSETTTGKLTEEQSVTDKRSNAYDVLENTSDYGAAPCSPQHYEEFGLTARPFKSNGETCDSDNTEYESYDDDVTVNSCYDQVTWSTSTSVSSESSASVNLTGASFYGLLSRMVGPSTTQKKLCILRGPVLMCFDPEVGGSQSMKHLEDFSLDEYCVERGQEDAMHEIRLTKPNHDPIVFCTENMEYANRWIQELKSAVSQQSYVVLQSNNGVASVASASVTCSTDSSSGNENTISERNRNTSVTLPMKHDIPLHNTELIKRGNITSLDLHSTNCKKSSKFKQFIQSLTKKTGRRHNTECIFAGCVEVCSNMSTVCQSFSQRHCVVGYGTLSCYADTSDSPVLFSLTLSGTMLTVERWLMKLTTSNGRYVSIKISNADQYNTWYTALIREGVSRPHASSCTSGPNQVATTDMYEEISPLQSHQMSQALLYEEVGAVIDRISVIHRSPPPIPSTTPPMTQKSTAPSTSPLFSSSASPTSQASPTSPASQPGSIHRPPPPIPTTAPPLSPCSSVTDTPLEESRRKNKVVEDYMTPSELREHMSKSRTISPCKSRDAIYVLEASLDDALSEHIYMNVERTQSNLRRSRSFDRENYMDMSQCGVRWNESRPRLNCFMKDVVQPSSTTTAAASSPTAASSAIIHAIELSLQEDTLIRPAPTQRSDVKNSLSHSLSELDPSSTNIIFEKCGQDKKETPLEIHVKPLSAGDVDYVCGSGVDCPVGECRTKDRPEAVFNVQRLEPTDSKTSSTDVTSLATLSVRHGGSNTPVTMVTTTTSDVRLSSTHQSPSFAAKTTKMNFVSSVTQLTTTRDSTSTKLKTSKENVEDAGFASSRSVTTHSVVSMAPESLTTIAQERGKVNRRLTSDAIVYSGNNIKVNAVAEGRNQRSSDPPVNELPKGLVQARVKMFQSAK